MINFKNLIGYYGGKGNYTIESKQEKPGWNLPLSIALCALTEPAGEPGWNLPLSIALCALTEPAGETWMEPTLIHSPVCTD